MDPDTAAVAAAAAAAAVAAAAPAAAAAAGGAGGAAAGGAAGGEVGTYRYRYVPVLVPVPIRLPVPAPEAGDETDGEADGDADDAGGALDETDGNALLAAAAAARWLYEDGYFVVGDGDYFQCKYVNVAAAELPILPVGMQKAVAQAVREGIPAVNFQRHIISMVLWVDRTSGLANQLIGQASAPILLRGPNDGNLHFLLLYIKKGALSIAPLPQVPPLASACEGTTPAAVDLEVYRRWYRYKKTLTVACNEVRSVPALYSSMPHSPPPSSNTGTFLSRPSPFHNADPKPHKAGSVGGARWHGHGLPSVLAVTDVFGHTSGPADIGGRCAERGGYALRAVRQHDGESASRGG